MAQVANTYDTYDSGRNREDLDDVISRLTPAETPFRSLIGTTRIDSVHPEWLTDTLATPSVANAFIQGDVYSFQAITATTRVGNYTQISRKEFIITETQEVVSKAGPKSDYARELVKKGMELKTDQEVSMLSNNASIAGNNATAPQSGGLRAWVATNDQMGTGGVSGGFSAGLVTAATNGTKRAFTKAIMDAGIAAGYTAGGNPDILIVSPYIKSVFSTFMADANVAPQRTLTRAGSQAQLIGAADGYVSDFGVIDVVPNRQLARADSATGLYTRNAYLVDKSMLSLGVLRPIQQDKDVAKTADALPAVLKTEWTLIVRNEAAQVVYADLFGLNSTT
jgi:hypothetical protein